MIAVEKIKYLADNPEVAKQIAQKGMKKLLKAQIQARWEALSKYLIEDRF